MVDFKSVMKFLGLTVGSIVVGFIVTMFISMPFEGRLEELPFGGYTPLIIWGSVTLVLMVLLRGYIRPSKEIGSDVKERRGRIVSEPQFRGSLDRERGIVESTARSIVEDRVSDIAWGGVQKDYNIVRIRAELLDEMGTPIEYIPIEIKGESNKWVGSIHDGDRFRVEGEFEEDGILHSNKLFNYSTNSLVGERK